MNPPALPKGLLRITVVALVFSGLMGFRAAQGLTALFDSRTPTEAEISALRPLPGLESQPEVYHQALKALFLAQVSAYESMKGSRTLILMGLWALSALIFVSSLRMLNPRGTPRNGVRQLLSTTLLLAAILRTLDGAQSAAVANRGGRAFDRVLSKGADLPGGWPDGLWASGYTALSIALSFIAGGSLLLLSRYYRSQRIADITQKLDTPS